MNARAIVKRFGDTWGISIAPEKGVPWIEMGGFPTMKAAIFTGNSIMRKFGWKLKEDWGKRK